MLQEGDGDIPWPPGSPHGVAPHPPWCESCCDGMIVCDPLVSFLRPSTAQFRFSPRCFAPQAGRARDSSLGSRLREFGSGS
eukprot:8718487-Alexandrium_andersonii.AAC.1